MNPVKEWRAQISEIDESMGRKPRYPHTLHQYHLENVFEKQKEELRRNSSEISNNAFKAANHISGSIEHGFDLLINSNKNSFKLLNSSVNDLIDVNNQGFDKVLRSLENINITLNKNFLKIIELNKQRNILLDDIVQLLNIPDDEKKRKTKIEKGLEFLKKSRIDTSVFDIAKMYFEQALELDNEDYFVLYNLGYIYLFSAEHINFNEAKKYFLLSAKFSYLDINFEKERFTKHLSSFKTTINPKLIATYSYYYAADCEYRLGNYDDALKLINKAINITPDLVIIMYDLSRYLAINNRINEAIDVLGKTIKKERHIAQSVYLDKNKDLIKHKEVVDYLKRIKIQTIEEGKKIYDECKKEISNNSSFHNELITINEYLNNETYLDALEALDLLKE